MTLRPYTQDSLQMLWLAAYLTGFPPAGLCTLSWAHYPPPNKIYLLGILSLDFSRLFLCPFQKSPHFFHLFSQKYLTNGSKNVALRALIKKGYPTRHRRLYSFEMEAFLCYPFTHRIHIPIIRTSLFLIF